MNEIQLIVTKLKKERDLSLHDLIKRTCASKLSINAHKYLSKIIEPFHLEQMLGHTHLPNILKIVI